MACIKNNFYSLTDKAEHETIIIKTTYCLLRSLPLFHIVHVILHGAVLIHIPPVWEEHFWLSVVPVGHPPLLLLKIFVRPTGSFCGLRLPALLGKEPSAKPPPLLLPPLPGLPALLLPRHLETLQEQVAGVLVQLDVPLVQLEDPALRLWRHVNAGGTCAVELREGRDELQVEGALKQILGLALVFGQAEEGHVAQVTLGALQEDGPALLLAHGGDVVAAHQTEIRQHAGLSVVGQVVGAVHELLQRAARPVVPRVAAGQLRQCW